MKFDFSVLAAATALIGSATAAPQNSNNGNNWQSYASQASSYWQSANPTATGDWSSWANAASSYWNSVSPSAAPSQWSSYASAASSYWASHSGSMCTQISVFLVKCFNCVVSSKKILSPRVLK
ncbi:hypothetical protein KCU64_g578, partial [Aureobasidium melanogenum]